MQLDALGQGIYANVQCASIRYSEQGLRRKLEVRSTENPGWIYVTTVAAMFRLPSQMPLGRLQLLGASTCGFSRQAAMALGFLSTRRRKLISSWAEPKYKGRPMGVGQEQTEVSGFHLP